MSDLAIAVGIVAFIFIVMPVIGVVVFIIGKSFMKLSRFIPLSVDQAIEDMEKLPKKSSTFIPLSVTQVIEDMEKEKPIRNNIPIAVKVLKGGSDKIIKEQFIAEVSTMGRTHHFNLVRLYGFCFESSLIALVYEYMVNGSLDNHLFKSNKGAIIGFQKLLEIAVGTANGISYLHEQCPQRIVHYDIKPGNILLDSSFSAKVSDFGLAKLCNRDSSHITMTGGRGTPGYVAPELWMPFPVTHKCDVYSFGMLLFEIIGRRRNVDVTVSNSQEWFPIWAWNKYEKKQLNEFMIVCGIEEKDEEVITRMLMVAFCCVQYRPENRPMMSTVVKMLEGAIVVPEPLNPFTHMFSAVTEPTENLARIAWNGGGSEWSSSEVHTTSTVVNGTPLMTRYEITVVTD
ncbi:serine-threonine/tyrosine-protein kinase catalytic domain-containing protein [Artemisia annua]|uniref:Serine-threonine/tyrosine-protein kinase catalytic domain-containing protein n=1 Tax=Artemisia annua TaxID=35608 RepID=A0A2U1MMI2_ARTAN|nr:serine-threonine/tyrosine-protein kinase catalytic domain-containing protein [Artemisia annua]